ncbi:class I SAM-dependent methyltransferase [Rubrobacter aplysinae]|uniref:class I SAM-dependent methyltransferase n=1 Tax=Rubrobacter aplysinae TaxID=909625 RepID=UPI00069E8DC3|nr:class I SAM-dependent methyltransferase [Rubrobacter aplysinae]
MKSGDPRRGIAGIPDYRDLDVSGEALAAARRMEDRAEAPASAALFEELVAPLLEPAPERVLEVGCGTAALSRRVARRLPGSAVYAADKSAGMLSYAAYTTERAGDLENLRLGRWDATVPGEFPFEGDGPFGLILSSVLVPYLDDTQTAALVHDLASRLAPGGVLAFVEQDLSSDSVSFPRHDLFQRIYAKDARDLDTTMALGLRPLLRDAGLTLIPRRSFLWTDEEYLPYTRGLVAGLADAALHDGRITPEERAEWEETLERQAATGDFYYGLVYHRLAGRSGGRTITP